MLLAAVSKSGLADVSLLANGRFAHERTFDIYHAPSNALINLAIKDAIAGEESSCIKCFP